MDPFPNRHGDRSGATKETHYGVVRRELLNRRYEKVYHQRMHEPDQIKLLYQLVAWREVIEFEDCEDRRIRFKLKSTLNGEIDTSNSSFDLGTLGTEYERKGCEPLLGYTLYLLPEDHFAIERKYKFKFRKDAGADDCGVWLQGCCEDSHGVGDVLPRCVQREID